MKLPKARPWGITENKLLTKDGEEIIRTIKIVNEDIPVYNLEVESNHNYYAEGYLAHNKAITHSVV